MKNILLTSAGGPAAVGVIKSLRDIKFNGKIVVTDCDHLSVGFHLADSYYVTPRTDASNFIKILLEIVEREEIDLILPTGADILPISKNADLFNNTKLFMCDHNTIQLCNDKWKFYQHCKDKFPLPKTSLDWNFLTNPLPIFSKPRIEQGGSRGAKICNNINDIDKQYGECIYQEILPGQEYTIDILCDMNSEPLIVIPRTRLQTKAGISSKGKIIKNTYIERQCYNICKFLKLKGPICIQMKEDIDDIPKFIEINPRFGGGTYFTTLAGTNFCEIILNILDNKEINIPVPESITVLRYFEEVVIYE
jgi:carbamoyl-phosphate synthase large subunit